MVWLVISKSRRFTDNGSDLAAVLYAWRIVRGVLTTFEVFPKSRNFRGSLACFIGSVYEDALRWQNNRADAGLGAGTVTPRDAREQWRSLST